MILTILKGFALGLLFFAIMVFLWGLITTTHIKRLHLKECEGASGQAIKTLSHTVDHRWFQRKHHDVEVYVDGPCVFFQFYPEPGVLYFGSEKMSGFMVRTAMTSDELRQFADTIPAHTDFQTMLDYLFARAKTHPAPNHEL